MPLVMFGGRVVSRQPDGMRHEHDPVLNRHYYSIFHMGDAEIARYLAHIRTLGPCYLHAYPSAATALALFARRTGVAIPPTVRGVILESETILGEQRALIAETFGCRLFSCYGQSEKVAFAAECDGSSLYHVWPTYGYVELLDSDGSPVTEIGRRGEIVATGFINDVMPFIRYRTGDYATLAGHRCGHCRRNHLLLADLRGFRAREHLVARDGSLVFWTALNLHDDTLARVRAFRFTQEQAGRAVLQVAPAEGFDDAEARRIEQRFRQKLDGAVAISCEIVADIPPAARGKAMYVDQRIPLEADDSDA
jgi:phenylacetate-CoA ligase